MNPVTDNEQDEPGMESTVSKDTIDLLRRFHFGEPAAAERPLPSLCHAASAAAAFDDDTGADDATAADAAWA